MSFKSLSNISLSQWLQSGQYFDFVGHRIFYRASFERDAREQTKPVLVLIHGFPTASWDWAKIWPMLAQHFELVTLDMLGFGYSDKPDQPYSLLEQADIFEALLLQLGIREYHILAHDYGDSVAQELLARTSGTSGVRSAELKSVVFSNGGLFPETHKPVLIQKLLLSPIGKWVARLASFEKFESTFDHICAKPISQDELQAYWGLLMRENGRNIMHRLIHYMTDRKTYRARWLSAMQNSLVPLHLVDGVLDPISGEHMAKRYEELIPKPSVVRLADTGHYPQVESPEAFFAGCITFWQQQGFINQN